MDLLVSSFSDSSSSSSDEGPTEKTSLLASSTASRMAPSINGDGGVVVDLHPADASGLSSAQAASLLQEHGPNTLPSGRRSPLVNLLRFLFLDLVSILVWLGVIISAVSRDWADLGVLLALQALNSVITFLESRKAAHALEALASGLAQTSLCCRDGQWQEISADTLVCGDIIRITIGRIVPADARLLSNTVRLDTSALTGESIPRTFQVGDVAHSGASCVAGDAVCVVEATGLNTTLGKSAKLIRDSSDRGPFALLLRRISLSLLIGSVVVVVGIVVIEVVRGARTWPQILQLANFAVALLITSIPVGLNAVCETTMAIGSARLAKRHGVIVSKLPTLLDLATMTVLCADKTGTLTQNVLSLREPWLTGAVSGDQLLLYAALAADYTSEHLDAIDLCIVNAVSRAELDLWTQLQFEPFEPATKRTSSLVQKGSARPVRIFKGSPQILFELAHFQDGMQERVLDEVDLLASRGFRSIGVCIVDEKRMGTFLGIISLHDPLRMDTMATVTSLAHLGVELKMMSGDHHAICAETCRQLGLTGPVLGPEFFDTVALQSYDETLATIQSTAGFAECVPENKHFLVDSIKRCNGVVVGMTGDGVNDAPALKQANIGIAVEGATDAARAASDLVFASSGLRSIVACVLRGRKIFARIRTYLMFRIAISCAIMVASLLLLLIHDFSLPPLALVVLVIALDIAAISSAKDKVSPSQQPSQWKIGQLVALSLIIGFLGALEGCAAYWIGSSGGLFFSDSLNDSELSSLVFLALSIGSQLSVFVCRTEHSFFTRRPGWSLLATAILGVITAAAIAMVATFEGFSRVIWRDAACVLVLCVGFFLVKDLVKVVTLQGFQHMEKAHAKELAFFEQNQKLLDDVIVVA